MSDHQKDSSRLAKNTGFMLLRLLIVATVGLYSSRVVLDVLGESDFGVYNVVGSVVVLLSFLRIALMVATNRYIAFDLGVGDMDRLKKTFSMCVNVHVILAGTLFVILEAVGPWFIANHLNIAPDRMTAAQVVLKPLLARLANLTVTQAPLDLEALLARLGNDGARAKEQSSKQFLSSLYSRVLARVQESSQISAKNGR